MRDDQVWDYAGGDQAEKRRFLLREATGRLVDGWGRALVVYADSFYTDSVPKNLVFVSAGPDGDYDDPIDNGELKHNKDNVEMRIEGSDWNSDDLKRTYTLDLLSKIREAIIGKPGIFVNGEYEPNGFIADIGNPEPLTGSYVAYPGFSDTAVYRCRKSHVSTSSIIPTNTAYWDTTGWKHASTYRQFPVWEPNRRYYRPSLDVLLVNADYVSYGGSVYRCNQSHTNQTPGGVGGYWRKDQEIEIPDTSKHPSWDATQEYFKEIVGPYNYDATTGLSCGWRTPYLSIPRSLPITDGWHNEIEAKLDSVRNIELLSYGLDKIPGTDDIKKTIYRGEYESPRVEIEVDTSNKSDTFYCYLPYNGYLSRRGIFDSSGATLDTFKFAGNPTEIKLLAAPVLKDSLIKDIADFTYSNTWLPVGRKSARYNDVPAHRWNKYFKVPASPKVNEKIH
jgi:hypothetical protein